MAEANQSSGEIGQPDAEALGVSGRTVHREWRLARAWLYKELHG